MALLNKNLKEYKYGFSSSKKKFGINYWRFFFNGTDLVSGSEQLFFLEFQMVNPHDSPNEVKLSFKSKPKLTEKDLQYVLAGTSSAYELQTESEIHPSYCSIKIGKLGRNPKQIACYFPLKDIEFQHNPFAMTIGNNTFTESILQGAISVSEEDGTYKPEYLCNEGFAKWNLAYEVKSGFAVGYKEQSKWFPCGLQTYIMGKINFDGIEYGVSKENCWGYSEKFWGTSLPEPWFHISANKLTSEITGKALFGSSFAVQGIFQDRISFVGKIENQEIIFKGENIGGSVDASWSCVQMPEKSDITQNMLHWSCSFTSKQWLVDVDVYCKIKDLFNKKVELPEGARKTLNIITGISDSGELKLYKRNGKDLEQIEHAKLDKVVCEFGEKEEFEY